MAKLSAIYDLLPWEKSTDLIFLISLRFVK